VADNKIEIYLIYKNYQMRKFSGSIPARMSGGLQSVEEYKHIYNIAAIAK